MKEVSHKGQHILWFQLYEIFRLGKSTEIESSLVVAWPQAGGKDMETWAMTANVHGMF